ncbi:hypothetical protein NL676_029738 [Syzygium grande]|nr:hypothetical protein NL676_029738 [Syzygium grande]
MEQLQSNLRAEIDGKRYLLVLDDLWNEELEKWLSLKKLLVGGARGSKILITTRIPLVAKITGTAPPHFLKGLSEMASLDLLMQMAGQKEEEIQDPEMVAIAKEIARKCNGVPLVVRTVGGQLSSLHRLTSFILPKDKALAKNGCELGELKELNNIRGSLCIKNLGSVTDAEAESKAANLIGKHRLESLALEWGYFNTDDVAIVDRDEALLGGLQPHSSLQKFTINRYKGESFPRWMISLPNLVEVCFYNCGRCKSLPPLGQLLYLKTLEIFMLTELECIESDRSSSPKASFPSLLKLEIRDCTKLKAMPQAPHLEELWLDGAHPALINMMHGLNKLKSLIIWRMESLECVPVERWKSLASLEKLYISFCPGLTSLSSTLGTRHQSNQVDLDSSDSEELDLSNYHESSGGNNLILELHSLRSVSLGELPKLASLPRWLLQASNLEHLEIEDCDELDICKDEGGNLIILDSHGALQNLRSMDLVELPKLASLPQWLLQLSNLEDLSIARCDELDICKDESGNLIILDSHGALQNLRSVDLIELPKLASLPQWLLQLSNLEDLSIRDCKELDICKDEGGNLIILDSHGALQNLRSVDLVELPKLASLPRWLLQLGNLEDLSIRDCKELDICKDESGNLIILDSHGGLHHSLIYVDLYGLPKLASLPRWLLQASNLEYLSIGLCSNLKALPEQIVALESLQKLEISECPSLTSLPEGIRRLASLTHLGISHCPELERRCKRDGGEDWHKIAHIPRIDFEI